MRIVYLEKIPAIFCTLLTIFFLTLLFSHNLNDCSLRFLKVQKIKHKPVSINKIRINQWVNAHSDEYKPLAKWISENIKVYSGDDVILKIQKHFEAFHKNLKPNFSIIFFTPGGKRKSNYWATGAVLSKNTELQHYMVTSNVDDISLYADANTYIALIDDASYSGAQLGSYITQVHHELPTFKRNLYLRA